MKNVKISILQVPVPPYRPFSKERPSLRDVLGFDLIS